MTYIGKNNIQVILWQFVPARKKNISKNGEGDFQSDEVNLPELVTFWKIGTRMCVMTEHCGFLDKLTTEELIKLNSV